MNNKATGVFWIGFLLIFMNFWLSGQSSTLWKAFTTGGAPGNLLGLLSSNTVNTGGGSGSNLPPLPLPGFPFVPPVTLASATVPARKKTGKSSSNPVNSPIASPGTTGPVVAGPPSNPVAYAQPLGGSGLGPASGTIFTNPNVSPLAWAKAVLTAAKFPQTKANQQSLIAWALNENTTAAYNPLATTLGPGASVFNSKNVWNYNGWPTGIQRTAATIHNGYYPQIVADLTAGKGITPASSANLHTWSGQGYNSITGNWVKAGQYMRQRAPVAPSPGNNPNAYQNPFRKALGLTPARVDQGVDYANPTGQQLPIYALGPGTIVQTTGGWPGGAFIAELLSAGPAKGQVVYAAETIKPKVSIGQKVTSNTIIGEILPGGVGIETGWGGTGAHLGNAAAYFAGQSNYGPGDVGAHPTAYGAAYNKILMGLGAPGGLFYQGNPVPAGQTVPGWASEIFRINKSAPASHGTSGKRHPGPVKSHPRIYTLVSFFRAPPKPRAKSYRPVPKRGPGHPTLR